MQNCTRTFKSERKAAGRIKQLIETAMPQLFYSEADVGLSVLGLRDIDGKDITGQVIPKEVDNYIKCEKYEGISSYKFKVILSDSEGHPAFTP